MVHKPLIPMFLIYLQCVQGITFEELTSAVANIPEDGRLQFCELAEKYNYKCIRYNVTTKDGYILGLFNIPGNKEKPVLLQHGFLGSSDDWLIRGKSSLVSFLADRGYDVWCGNMRGNMHSRAHVTLNPEHWKFWDFSFHEIAIYDMPATIDFILNTTGQSQLQAIGFSEGTTVFYILGSLFPEYNYKVKLLISCAPIAYIHNAEPPIFRLISEIGGSALSRIAGLTPHGELLGNSSALVALIRAVCTERVVGSVACLNVFLFSIFGSNPEQVEPEFLSIGYSHFPSGTSLKNAVHLFQIIARNKFGQYDYGTTKNMLMYHSDEPPDYDLSKSMMRHVFIVGRIDKLSYEKDAERLRNELPNIIEYHVMNWSHLDFVWGRNMTLLFVRLQKMLNKYY